MSVKLPSAFSFVALFPLVNFVNSLNNTIQGA